MILFLIIPIVLMIIAGLVTIFVCIEHWSGETFTIGCISLLFGISMTIGSTYAIKIAEIRALTGNADFELKQDNTGQTVWTHK